MADNTLYLASSSPYRKALLARTGLRFQVLPAAIDESRQSGEAPRDYVARLSLAKARAGAARLERGLVIGSDQACEVEGRVLGKPGGFDSAFRQLRDCAGRWVTFHTGVALARPGGGEGRVLVEPFQVRFRGLRDSDIRRYLEIDQPWDCAGGFKAEAAGICLFEEMRGRDFNALVGLPLIALLEMLREEGIDPLAG